MNNEPPENKRRLLDDVLREDSFNDFNQALKQQAFGTLRQARMVRRFATASSVVIVACLVVVGLQVGAKKSAGFPNNQPSVNTVAGKPAEISEQQLVAMFPPDSCFVAEVDGKKVLVFRDPDLRAQYLN